LAGGFGLAASLRWLITHIDFGTEARKQPGNNTNKKENKASNQG
jgi:hypothetical protein